MAIMVRKAAKAMAKGAIANLAEYSSLLRSMYTLSLGQVRVDRDNYAPGQLTEVVIRDRPKRRDASRLVNPEEKKP